MVGPPRGVGMTMQPTPEHAVQLIAAAIFAVALGHTFAAKQFERLSHRFPRHAGLFHLLGEVEVVFGFWAIVLVMAMALIGGGDQALSYAESRNYTEPLFVFVVMVVAASRPIRSQMLAEQEGGDCGIHHHSHRRLPAEMREHECAVPLPGLRDH